MDTKRYDLSIDNTLGGNNASHSVSPSQKAIKEYVDNHSSAGTQADWDESDPTDPAFINNKPTIPSIVLRTWTNS